MKDIIVIFKTIIAIVLVSLALFGVWQIYNSYIKQQKNVYWSIEDKPSKEQITQLLTGITTGSPKPNKTYYTSKQALRTIQVNYDNPSEQTKKLLMENIEKQGIWQEAVLNHVNGPEFCHDQYTLFIGDSTYTSLRNNKKQILTVTLGWYRAGICRSKYIDRVQK